MKKNKSSISKAQSYKEIGEYWDEHDLAEHWEETKPAGFEVDILSETTYYAVDNSTARDTKRYRSSEAFDKRYFEPSMAYKFNSGANLKYFDKVFENKDVIIYQLK
ncbi:MAG TPA: hypothetical protein VIO11_06445 [Candidatus Methanoperedens sp.]